MKIAWFHSHLLNIHSGGTRFVFDHSEFLQKYHGHDITIFCDTASEEAIQKAKKSRIRIIQIDKISTNSPWYWFLLYFKVFLKRNKIRPTLKSFDLIINSMFPMNWLVSGFSLPKIQICYEPFAFFYDSSFLKNFSFLHRIFFKVMKVIYSRRDREAVRGMNGLFTINKVNKEKIRKTYGISPDTVYAGIDVKTYKKVPQKELGELKRKHRGFPLLFHSTDLTGIKGTFDFLLFMKKLKKIYPDIHLLITVYVENKPRVEKLLRTIKKLNLSKNATYLGCLEEKLLPKYYSLVDFVCQPSINQPASWPLKEALACGTPIIGGAESEEIRHLKNGIKILFDKQEQSLRHFIELVERKKKIKVNKEEIIKKYSQKICVEQFNKKMEKIYALSKNK